MQGLSLKRKLKTPALMAVLAAFLCIYSLFEIEPSNSQLVASLLVSADHEADHQFFALTKIQENESLDKSDVPSREDFEQALPHRNQHNGQVGARHVQPACIARTFAPVFKLVHPASKLVGANESYVRLPLCYLFCSLLI